MANRKRHSAIAVTPVDRGFQVDAIGASIERRRFVCEQLDALADDVCGPRSRQAAANVLEFMSRDRFGVPDDQADALLSAMPDRLSAHPAFDALRESLEYDPRVVRRMERAAVKGLETILLGRIPENPLDFILAAFALVERERRYAGILMERVLPLLAADQASVDHVAFGDAGAGPRDSSGAMAN